MSNIITKVEIQKNNKKRVNVYINEDYAFSCDAELVYKYELKKNTTIDIKALDEVISEDNFMKAKNDSLKYLERSYKTEQEIGEKLKKKGYDGPTIEKTISFLKEYNFINDNKYAEMYIKDKQKAAGRIKLKYDLIKKGIGEDVARQLTAGMDESVESNRAEELAAKKFNIISQRETDKKKIYEKLLRFLVGKGFSFEISKTVIRKVMNFQIEE